MKTDKPTDPATLKKVAIGTALVVVAVLLGWRGYVGATDNSGYKAAPILTPAQRKAELDAQIKAVENNPNMAPMAREATINMLKSHSAMSGAVARTPTTN